jgi:putative ABC transport system permease protein
MGTVPAEENSPVPLKIGHVLFSDQCRDIRVGGVLDGFWQDIRFAFRTLIKRPGFTLVAVLALALGIGASTGIFSVINAVLLRPLSYPAPDQIVYFEGVNQSRGLDDTNISALDFLSWKEQSNAFIHMALFVTGSANLADVGGEPERLSRAIVTSSFFSVIRVQPFLGRAFTSEEDQPGREPVAILGHALWKRSFGGDPNVIGRQITLNARRVTIVGVMPAGFDFPERAEIWSALPIETKDDTRDNRSYSAIGRLKRDVSLKAAQAQISAINAQLAAAYRDTNIGWDTHLARLHDRLVREVRPSLIALAGAVGFVLLIACANVANLLLARTAARRREMAIRAALGASRSRVIRQLLTESVLLSLVGGSVGVLFGVWFTHLLVRFSPAGAPRFEEIGLDGRVLAFALAVSCCTGLLFGLAPAFHAVRGNVSAALDAGTRGAGESIRSRMRSFLLIAEVSLSLMLLVGAGLLIQSFLRLREVKLGFNPNGVLTASISLPYARYPEDQQRVRFFHELTRRLRLLPGVTSAATVLTLPLNGSDYSIGRAFVPEGRPLGVENSGIADYSLASEDYFRTMEIPLLAGRAFTDRDTANSPMVVIINQTLARQCFGSTEDAIGKRLTIWRDEKFPREIVGVVGETQPSRLDEEAGAQMYVPHAQDPSWGFMSVVIRTAGDTATLVPALRREVLAMDKDEPIFNVQTMQEIVAKSALSRRTSMVLFTGFAVVALLLAAFGIYGVMAYSVSLRTHEIGVRMALGAQRSDVLRLVIGQGMEQVCIGVLLGIVGVLGLTRVMGSLLFAVRPNDPLTLLTISLVVLGVSLLACYVPARRAAKVNPTLALSTG